MATYIPGLTDTPVNPVQFTPDYNFLATALSHKDTQYAEGMRKVSGQYQSLMRDLSNNENIQTRDTYLKEAEKQLTQLVSGTDLSLPQNEAQADRIFAPFWEDKDMMSDFIGTQVGNGKIKSALALRDSKNKDERDMYWDTGVAALQYRLNDLKSAKRGDGSLQNVEAEIKAARYTPNRDINKYLSDLAGQSGLSIESTGKGPYGYLLKTKNGEESTVSFKKFVTDALMGNQQMLDVFNTRAYVDYRKTVDGYIQTGLPEKTAKDTVIGQIFDQQKAVLERSFPAEKSLLQQLDAKQKGREQALLAYGDSIPTDGEGKRIWDEYNATKPYYESYSKELEESEKKLKSLSDTNSDEYKKLWNDISATPDQYLAQSYVASYVPKAAEMLQMKGGVKSDLVEDPYIKSINQLTEHYKENQEDNATAMFKKLGTGNSASDGSSTGGNNSKDDARVENLGLSIKSNDNVDAYQRMKQIQSDAATGMVESQKKIALQLANDLGEEGTVDSGLIHDLAHAIETGSYAEPQPIGSKNHIAIQRLKDAGIIPNIKDYNLQKPAALLGKIVEYAKNYYQPQGHITGNIAAAAEFEHLPDLVNAYEKISKISKETEKQVKKAAYGEVEKMRQEVTNKFRNETSYKKYFNSDGSVISRNEFINRVVSKVNGHTIPGAYPNMNNDGVNMLGKQYDEFLSKYKSELNSGDAQFFDENGNAYTKDKYLTKVFGTTNKDAYVANESARYQSIQDDSGSHPNVIQERLNTGLLSAAFDKFSKNYDEFRKKLNTKIAPAMSNYLNVDAAYNGRDVSIGGSKAQALGEHIFSDANLAEQGVNREGANLPLNIDDLTSTGASQEDISKVVDILRANRQSLNRIVIRKIGSTGELSATVRPEELKKIMEGQTDDEKKSISKALQAINRFGMEFKITSLPESLNSVHSDYSQAVIDNVLYKDVSNIKASPYLKSLGYNYWLTDMGDHYTVNIKGPIVSGGVLKDKKPEPFDIPKNAPLGELRSAISAKIINLYQQNVEALQISRNNQAWNLQNP